MTYERAAFPGYKERSNLATHKTVVYSQGSMMGVIWHIQESRVAMSQEKESFSLIYIRELCSQVSRKRAIWLQTRKMSSSRLHGKESFDHI
jgi:hypothetical protein